MKGLNLRFFLLQGLLILVECITISYISPILVSLGYSNLRIGWVMTLGTLASTLARPVWGVVNDRLARPKQIVPVNIALGSACYFLLTHGGGRPAPPPPALPGAPPAPGGGGPPPPPWLSWACTLPSSAWRTLRTPGRCGSSAAARR